MIMADSFVQSKRARDSEFTTNRGIINAHVFESRGTAVDCFIVDRPLVVQFASNNARDFADAAELVTPYVLHQTSY